MDLNILSPSGNANIGNIEGGVGVPGNVVNQFWIVSGILCSVGWIALHCEFCMSRHYKMNCSSNTTRIAFSCFSFFSNCFEF